MTLRIYIMPIESATVDGRVYRGPKYFRSRNRLAPDAELQSVSYGSMPFGQSTVRQILRTFGEQWGFRALKLGMVSL